MQSTKKKVFGFVLIISVIVVILYIITFLFGTKIAIALFGINEDNTLFDKTYNLYAYDTNKILNTPRNRIILYSKNQDKNNLKALVLTYSKYHGRLIYVTSLKIKDEGIDIKEHHVFSKGDIVTDFYQEVDNPYVTTISFPQYNNRDPKEVTTHEYTSMEYYDNGVNYFYISIGVLDSNKNINEVNEYLKDIPSKELFKENISDDKIIVIYEAVDVMEPNKK